MNHKKTILIILDGWGHGPRPEASAIAQAATPFMDSLYAQYPHAELVTYGEEVGLPEGQMGNSEVGHLNIGAGRVVYRELARINKAIREEMERGVFDIEAVQKANDDLVATINESLEIADEGKRKRAEAEEKLGKMEAELRDTLASASARGTAQGHAIGESAG